MKAWVLGAALMLGLAGPANSQQTTLKWTFVNPMNSHFGAAATAFKTSVEGASQGRIKVEIFPAGALGGEREIAESLQLGSIDMAHTSTSVVGNFVPEVLIFDIPFLFRDSAHARAVVDGPIGADILAKFPAKDLIGLGFGENGFRHLTNNKRPVGSPADMSGMTIRTMENEIHIQAFKTLGARPTPIAWPELFAALQQGVVDGEENPLSNIVTAKFFQVQKYLSLTGHVYAPTVIMISPATWKKLPDADKAIVKEGVAKAIAAQRQAVDEYERSGIKTLQEQGMTIDQNVNKALFVEKLGPAYEAFATRFGKDKIEAIKATR